MEVAVKVALVALVVAFVWWVLQPRYAFVVMIHNAVARVSRGRVAGVFLQELTQVCAEAGVIDGWVGGVRRGRQTSLAFSRGIPPATQQRLRNLWAIHG